MKLLLVLLSVMTFTIQSKNSVSMDGLWPYDITVDYRNTGTKGNVKAGDKATLSLGGLENIRLESVTLYLSSNQYSGAGVITMAADGALLYSKSGSYADWFGGFNTGSYQPIGWSGTKDLSRGTLVIELTGTENSLHIEKFEVRYQSAPERPFEVTLVMDGKQQIIQETAVGSGVVLPSCLDIEDWFFAGWSTIPVAEQTLTEPYLFRAGETIYPKKDMSLWAVWTDVELPTREKQTRPEDGYYTLELHNLMLCGVVENGLVPMMDAGMVYYSSLYELTFDTVAEVCTIQNAGGMESYVGYNLRTQSLADAPSEWRYMLLPDSTWLFIATQDNEDYWILYQRGLEYYAWLHNYVLGDNPNGGWEMYAMPDPNLNVHWWSYPTTHGLAQPNAEGTGMSKEWIIPMGLYELRIKNGMKELRIKH